MAYGCSAILVLADGTAYPGNGFGARKGAVGELVFNTSMTGYQEALTDPSYAGQILTFSFPLIGNYGVSKEAFESDKIQPNAVVVKEWCEKPAHRQGVSDIHEFLCQSGIPGICGVDTREIVIKVRSSGVVPAALVVCDESGIEEAKVKGLKMLEGFDYGSVDFVKNVTGKKVETVVPRDGGTKHSVALVDYGAKGSIAAELAKRGCKVMIFPASANAKEILAHGPDGVMLSNGPGDPSLLDYAIETCRGLLGKKPVFGICLGHQILGHALGAKTRKLKFGHRGANQPVIERRSGKCFMTSQNHGYEVCNLPGNVEEWMVNLNDGSNEGLRCGEKDAFSVQFHPEAAPGPRDTSFLFDEFLEML